MQPKSIPEPVCVENERTPAPFPKSGDNFVTVTQLDNLNDPFAFLEALAFVHDCTVALDAFKQGLECTGTGKDGLSDDSESKANHE